MKKTVQGTQVETMCAFLKKLPMFSNVDASELNSITSHCKTYKYEKGDTVCKRGQIALGVYIIEYGTVTEFAIDWNGFNIIVKTGGRLDAFGELGVLLDEGYLTTVIAETPCQIVFISKEAFNQIIWNNQSSIKEILSMLSQRLQKSAQKSISYTLFNAEGRLAYILSIMHVEKRHPKYVVTTQEELSVRCGIARQTISTIMSKWQKSGVIKLGRGKVEVIQPDILEELAIQSAKHY